LNIFLMSLIAAGGTGIDTVNLFMIIILLLLIPKDKIKKGGNLPSPN